MKGFLLSALLFTCSVFILGSCEADKPAAIQDPVITLTSDSTLTVGYEGGECAVAYFITNPVKDGSVKVSYDAAWITGCETSVAGKVRLTVSPNDGALARDTDVRVEYTCGDISYGGFDIYLVQEGDPGQLSVSIEVEPGIVSAVLHLKPSNGSDWYMATVVEKAVVDYYADEEVMSMICEQYGLMLSLYAYRGDKNLEVDGMMPSTDYCAVAFGVDMNTAEPSGGLYKKDFTTLESGPTDASAFGEVKYHWDYDKTVAVDPGYNMFDGVDAIAVIDWSFNSSAVKAYYTIFQEDCSEMDKEGLKIISMKEGYIVNKGDPATLVGLQYGQIYTLCVVAQDSKGNFAEPQLAVFTLSYESASDDYDLFRKYYNDYMTNY